MVTLCSAVARGACAMVVKPDGITVKSVGHAMADRSEHMGSNTFSAMCGELLGMKRRDLFDNSNC
jgi:hypothetical protein